MKKLTYAVSVACLTLAANTYADDLKTGFASYEQWTGLNSAVTLDSIPVDTTPTKLGFSSYFETPSRIGDNYAIRMRAYLIPPESGDYTFWVAADDFATLRLSSDDDPANAVEIAAQNSWVPPRVWDRYDSQQSAPVTLEAGKAYFIEALMKENGGNDNLAVGWQLPNGTMERPIAGDHLSPYDTSVFVEPVGLASEDLETGFASYEVWSGIGTALNLESIPFDQAPTSSGISRLFETPTNMDNGYGARMRAYVIAPTTGDYVFWVSGDDITSMRISRDGSVDNMAEIAGQSAWTPPRVWDQYASQRSLPVPLEAGKAYLIEAILKESGGGDNLAVGWKLPDGTLERPIPGDRLSAYDSTFLDNIGDDLYAQGRWCVSSADHDHSLWLPDIQRNLHFDETGSFVENGDGTATMTGRVVNQHNSNQGFDVNVDFSGYIAPWEPTPSGSPKSLKSSFRIENGGSVDHNTWRYYNGVSGTLTGFGDWEGGVIRFIRRGPAFQVGLGANAKNTAYGGATWISYEIVSQPTNGNTQFRGNRGDININLTPCAPPEENDCSTVYALHDGGLNDSQFFTVDALNGYVTEALGEEKPGMDIEGLAIAANGQMYASSGDDPEGFPIGHLYTVDKETGEIAEVGSTGLGELSALSFRPSDGLLWTWGDRQGIYVIDPSDASVIEEVLPSDAVEVEDMAWIIDMESGEEILYGSVQRELWAYDPKIHAETNNLELAVQPVCNNLPGQTEALEGMPDGTLLFGVHTLRDLMVYSLDPKTCEVVSAVEFETPYNDIEGIAWNCR